MAMLQTNTRGHPSIFEVHMAKRRDYAYFSILNWKTRLLNQLRRAFTWPPLEKSLQRRVQGKLPASNWSKFIPQEYLYSKGTWRNVHRGPYQLRLDLSNSTDHWAYFAMRDPGHEAFLAMIKPGNTVIDIGANIGLQSLTYSTAVGTTGKVIAFEPHPRTFERLNEHLQLNRVTNVEAFNIGIGPVEAILPMYEVVESNSGMNRIINSMDDPERFPHVDVHIRPLGRIIDAQGRIDAIKIDVEGFEMEVLKGCEAVINTHRPILLIELDDDNLRENNSSAEELLAFLHGIGYEVRVASDGTPLEGNLADKHFDILCTPTLRTADLLQQE